MTAFYLNQNNNDENKNNPDELGYDLEFEKERIKQGTEEIKNELLEKWQKQYLNIPIFPQSIAGLGNELLDFMLPFKLTLFYNKISNNFRLNQNQRDILPQIVWQIVINKKWEDVKNILQSKLVLDAGSIDQIAQLLDGEIFTKAKGLSSGVSSGARREFSREIKKEPVSLPILHAIQKYAKIGEQPITGSPIHLRHFPAPARPSIKNWISDFHEKMGPGKHGMVERGNYLFQSENAKSLNNSDRQKLAYVLKSLDENTPLTVDAENERIIFPEKTVANFETRPPVVRSQQPAISQQPTRINFQQSKPQAVYNRPPVNKVDEAKPVPVEKKDEAFVFSSPHKFPTEKRMPSNRITPMGNFFDSENDSNNDYPKNPTIKKNVVDLRN